MTLSEKIYYCRKRAGLSQEALSQRVGVSRQAVSKWETGDAEPELSKLRLLAETFGVTTDWLLSSEEPEEAKGAAEGGSGTSLYGSWVDSVPGVIGRLLRRYGWLFGVYLAVMGAGLTGFGALARFMTRRMFSGFGTTIPGAQTQFSAFVYNNPVSVMGTVMMGVGIVLIAAGVILAIVLKRRGRE